MTDKDYIAISNTGKNITITMTPGMKRHVLGRDDRIRMFYSCGGVHLIPSAPPDGYKLRERKNVWNVSMASARCPDWPIHERAVYRMSQIEFQGGAARVPLPKTSSEEEFINAGGANIRMVVGESAPARMDYRDMHMPKFVEDAPPKECRQFNVPDMVVAAIAGGAIGVLITLLLAAAGVLK